MAKYPYIVKHNGEWYEAGENVPDTVEAAEDESIPPFSDADIEFESAPEGNKQYTKTDINKMNKAELQELAKNMGAEDPDDMTGTELKEYLLGVFGL